MKNDTLLSALGLGVKCYSLLSLRPEFRDAAGLLGFSGKEGGEKREGGVPADTPPAV